MTAEQHAHHRGAVPFNTRPKMAHAITTTPVGFEPTRGDPIGSASRRLNHSARVSSGNRPILRIARSAIVTGATASAARTRTHAHTRAPSPAPEPMTTPPVVVGARPNVARASTTTPVGFEPTRGDCIGPSPSRWLRPTQSQSRPSAAIDGHQNTPLEDLHAHLITSPLGLMDKASDL